MAAGRAVSLRLLDERSEPPLRTRIGTLMAAADAVDFAVGRIRLANLDLSPEEVDGPARCRVLVGRLDASTLLDADTARAVAVERLIDWARSGRLAVRSAGIGSWTPDFSVYTGPGGRHCLVGAHYFGSPQLTVGPSFTLFTQHPESVALLDHRFERLWRRSHDVLPAIVGVLERVRETAVGS